MLPYIIMDVPITDLLRSAETLGIFKSLIKTWEGPNCKCNFWKHLVSKLQNLPSH